MPSRRRSISDVCRRKTCARNAQKVRIRKADDCVRNSALGHCPSHLCSKLCDRFNLNWTTWRRSLRRLRGTKRGTPSLCSVHSAVRVIPGQAIASVLELVADLRCDSSDSEAETPVIRSYGNFRCGGPTQVLQGFIAARTPLVAWERRPSRATAATLRCAVPVLANLARDLFRRTMICQTSMPGECGGSRGAACARNLARAAPTRSPRLSSWVRAIRSVCARPQAAEKLGLAIVPSAAVSVRPLGRACPKMRGYSAQGSADGYLVHACAWAYLAARAQTVFASVRPCVRPSSLLPTRPLLGYSQPELGRAFGVARALRPRPPQAASSRG